MNVKKVLGVYVVGFIAVLFIHMYGSSNISISRGLCISVLILMMLALDFIKFGKDQRMLYGCVAAFAGLFGIFLGMASNPQLDWIIAKPTIMIAGLAVLLWTYRTLKDE